MICFVSNDMIRVMACGLSGQSRLVLAFCQGRLVVFLVFRSYFRRDEEYCIATVWEESCDYQMDNGVSDL